MRVGAIFVSARVAKFPVNCELPHIGAPKNM